MQDDLASMSDMVQCDTRRCVEIPMRKNVSPFARSFKISVRSANQYVPIRWMCPCMSVIKKGLSADHSGFRMLIDEQAAQIKRTSKPQGASCQWVVMREQRARKQAIGDTLRLRLGDNYRIRLLYLPRRHMRTCSDFDVWTSTTC